MADNATLPATGTVVAADDISGVLHQRVKISLGAEGAADDLAPGRAAAAASVPVALSTEDLAALDSIDSNTATAATVTATIATNTDRTADATEALLADTTPMPTESGVYLVSVTPVISTSIYAALDSLFDSTVITNATRQADMGAVLQSVTVIDKDKEAAAISLVFFSFNVTTWGAANAAQALTDAESVYILGQVDIAAADYKAHANQSVATKVGLGISLMPASGTRNVYVAAFLPSGTPTYTAATDLVIRCGMLG